VTDLEWLADLGLVTGARVGSTVTPRQFGTVVDVEEQDSLDHVIVLWDDGATAVECWTDVAPLGYLAEPAHA
jgi:hypothetical protein